MTILSDETPRPITRTWWQNIVVALEPIYDTVKKSSLGLTQGEIEAKLDMIHHAYSKSHRVVMPIDIQAQLIATICHIQMSYCARYEGQTRISAKHHRIAQIEWIFLQEMLHREGIDCRVLH